MIQRLGQYCWIILFGLMGSSIAAADILQPHLAVYDLALGKLRAGSGIASIKGRMVLELSNDCDGYITNQRLVMEIINSEGHSVVNDFSISSWERLDGQSYNFVQTNAIDGRITQQREGNAEHDRDGARVKYSKPSEQVETLPQQSFFPSAHTIEILNAARDGRRTAAVMLFDGSDDGGLFDTFSSIGQAQKQQISGAGAALSQVRGWPIRISFFPVRQDTPSEVETPEFEVGVYLHENGIASQVEFDYGRFTLQGGLSQLEIHPVPQC